MAPVSLSHHAMWYLFLIGFALIFLWFLFLWKRKKKRREQAYQEAGESGERQVAARLKKIGRFRHYRYLHNLYLPIKEGTTQIDHIVAGAFGVLVVESKQYSGEVYGHPSEERWLHIKKGKRRKFYNPIMQNQTHVLSVRAILAAEEIFCVPVYSLVVFAGNHLRLLVPKGAGVVPLKKLKKELKKGIYRQDNGVDAAQIIRALEKNALTGKKVEKEQKKYAASRKQK